jgi:nucleoid-associated protein YgaU
MGKLEKVIVLSVLFVIAVITVVSLTTESPLDKSNVAVLGAPASKPDATPPAAPDVAQNGVPAATAANAQTQPGALLSSNVNTAPASNAAAPACGIPPGSLLKRLDGLQDSYLADMKFYTWKSGDSYRGIAEQYYGDWTKFPLLRRANEGRKQVQIGEKVLVPVFDLDPAATASAPGLVAALQNAPAANVPAPATTAPVTERAKTPVKPVAKKATTTTSAGGKVHVVKEGESLWKIAKAELGNGAHWNKIYEANKDVMKSPEALKTGMKLKIP